jgi:glycosyltransferase involved in cell wall biosynthesis
MLVTTYNRAEQAERCVRSCMQQTFQDFEIVVVDDASTDPTSAVLATLDEPRLRIVRHERNRGISPARATAVDHAQGEWCVMVDSDWELFPHTLARLHTLIDALPPGVRIIRSRLQLDDGSVCPLIIPTGITGYHDRLLWIEAVNVEGAGSDAGHCIHRSVFETTNYFAERRGGMEGLWELNLARRESSLWVPDILGREHTDAPNSHSRGASAARLIRMLDEAPDGLWMAETMLAEHGAEMARYAPHSWRYLVEHAALFAFLSGDRRAGIRHTWAAIRDGSVYWRVWGTLALGILDPRALAYAKVAGRRWRVAARDLVRHSVFR